MIALSAFEEAILVARARAARGQHRDVLRARIVLAAVAGTANAVIAAGVGVHVDTVRKWRRRFARDRIAGLDDLPRSGRPRGFTAVQVAQVKALACTLPAETGLPLSRWSSAELAAEVIDRGVADRISPSTVRRWLDADAIKPGSTGPGSSPATPTSRPRPPGCWTCMPAAGTGRRWARTTT